MRGGITELAGARQIELLLAAGPGSAGRIFSSYCACAGWLATQESSRVAVASSDRPELLEAGER